MIALIGYLLGSINMSIIYSKYILKDDVRNHGSGNAGATNAARVFGWKAGILTFVFDFLKCCIAVGLGLKLGGEWGKMLGGMACLMGHCFPVYFGFKGGKGVSTGACIAFLIDWRIGLMAVLVFAIVVLITRLVSMASLCSAVTVAVAVFIFKCSVQEIILGEFTALLLIVMHHENIRRLIRHEENQFRSGGR